MEKVKRKKKLEKADIAHQLSWENMEQKVVKFIREGDAEGLQKFVEEFTTKTNSLLEELKDDPELYAEMETLLTEQQRKIRNRLTDVLEAEGKWRG